MESDAILEGFKCSVEQHGLIYNEIIADNDSSVWSKLYGSNVYDSYGISIKKTECINHLRRNLCKKVMAISTGKVGSKFYRDMIGEKVLKFRAAVTNAANYRRGQNCGLQEKIRLLRNDINNIPNHIFGNHENCDDYFCNKKKSNEPDLTTQLELEGLMMELRNIMTNCGLNAESLLLGKQNNIAECFNNVVAKFVGGKRVNFGLTCSYSIRTAGAVVQFNTRAVFSKINEEMNYDALPLIDHMERQRKLHNDTVKVNYNLKKITGSYDSSKDTSADKKKNKKDYGVNCQRPDLDPKTLSLEVENFKKVLFNWQADRLNVEKRTKNVISNDEKVIKYKKLLMTEHFGKVCKKQQNSRYGPIVEHIISSKLYGTKDANYKIIYKLDLLEIFKEKSMFLETLEEVEFEDSGIIIDNETQYFAALPDFLLNDHSIIEIIAPTKGSELTVPELRNNKINELNVILNDKIELNQNHGFFYGIQGILHVTKRQTAIVVIITNKDFREIIITRDDSFWKTKMEKKLLDFYENHVIPEIVDSRINRSMSIRELDDFQKNDRTNGNDKSPEKILTFKNLRRDERMTKIFVRGKSVVDLGRCWSMG